MKIKNFIYVLLAAYLATFLRLTINNNFLISIIGSFLVGFFISRKLSYATEKILLSGFFSCFTSFSGFIYFLYTILNQGDWIKFIIFSFDKPNRFEIKNPKNKDPIIETIILLFINTLKKVAK